MPIHIEEMNTQVTAVDGEMPLNEAQIEKLVKIVLQRLQQQERAAQRSREATTLRPHAAPPWPAGERDR